jgi:hypothetical protein
MSGRSPPARRDLPKGEKPMFNETWPTAIDENGVVYFVPPTKLRLSPARDSNDEEISEQSNNDEEISVQSDEEIAIAAQAAVAVGTWRFKTSLREELPDSSTSK